eukprot:TRINITY_DN1388_c1_g1_i4.p5 TRINITY_DN1388_c1_g1~~TRINITY_DN1388_c1_g1_i4.p5  ORF type:complete len:119 (-),score=9.94 TRINITY_DN1388_c1_g1_i4:1514-1870(-)
MYLFEVAAIMSPLSSAVFKRGGLKYELTSDIIITSTILQYLYQQQYPKQSTETKIKYNEQYFSGQFSEQDLTSVQQGKDRMQGVGFQECTLVASAVNQFLDRFRVVSCGTIILDFLLI